MPVRCYGKLNHTIMSMPMFSLEHSQKDWVMKRRHTLDNVASLSYSEQNRTHDSISGKSGCIRSSVEERLMVRSDYVGEKLSWSETGDSGGPSSKEGVSTKQGMSLSLKCEDVGTIYYIWRQPRCNVRKTGRRKRFAYNDFSSIRRRPQEDLRRHTAGEVR